MNIIVAISPAHGLVACPPGWIPNTSPNHPQTCSNPDDEGLGLSIAIILTGGLAILGAFGDNALEDCLDGCDYKDGELQLQCYEGCRIAFSPNL